MTTNKTPIQEFKEYIFNTINTTADPLWLKQTVTFLEGMEQKEKAFAFDCFEAGRKYEHERDGFVEHSNYYFEQFYSQYAEKHTD